MNFCSAPFISFFVALTIEFVGNPFRRGLAVFHCTIMGGSFLGSQVFALKMKCLN